MSNHFKRVLSIDGGGVRGLLSALVLADLERRLKDRSLAESFDLIAGTSSGGLIALGLAKGLTAAELVDVFDQRSSTIFPASWFGSLRPWFGQYGAKYSAEGLQSVLRDVLGNSTLASIGAMSVEDRGRRPLLMVPSYDLQQCSSRFFKSWKSGHQNLPAWQVARATSAAPTIFPPFPMEIPQDMSDTPPLGSRATMVDGGLFSNNPGAAAWAEARKLWPNDSILLVSVGTGERKESHAAADTRGWNLLKWLRPTLAAMFDGQADAVDHQLRGLLSPGDLVRLQCRLEHALSSDLDAAEPDNLRGLRRDAMDLIAKADGVLADLARRL